MIPVLDELSHVYHLEGKPLTSVTRVIKSVWPNRPTFDQAPIHVLEHARHRGERVDYWVCEYASRNGNIEVDDDTDVVQSVNFFDQWWSKTQPSYLDHQRTVWSEAAGVCGRFDLLLLIDGRPTIVDVKRTHNEEETWPIQLGGYRDLYHHSTSGDQFRINDIGVLHIHPRFKAGYIFRHYNVNEATECWQATVQFWKAVQVFGKMPKHADPEN